MAAPAFAAAMGSPNDSHTQADRWPRFFEQLHAEWTDDSDDDMFFFSSVRRRVPALSSPRLPADEGIEDWLCSDPKDGPTPSDSARDAADTAGSSRDASDFYSMSDTSIRRTRRNAGMLDAFRARKMAGSDAFWKFAADRAAATEASSPPQADADACALVFPDVRYLTQMSPRKAADMTPAQIEGAIKVRHAVDAFEIVSKRTKHDIGGVYSYSSRVALRRVREAQEALEMLLGSGHECSRNLYLSSMVKQYQRDRKSRARSPKTPERHLRATVEQRTPLNSLRESASGMNTQAFSAPAPSQQKDLAKKPSPLGKTSAPSKAPSKRIEDDPVRKIFEFCAFLFLPIRNSSAERENLVAAVKKRGAEVLEGRRGEYTHIVVDHDPKERYDLRWVSGVLRVNEIPNVRHLVFTDWIKQSILWNQMLDPLKFAPRVRGWKPEEPEMPWHTSDRMLLQAKKRNLALSPVPDDTTSRSEGSSERAADAVAWADYKARNPDACSPQPVPTPPQALGDLDEAIAQVKYLQELPLSASMASSTDHDPDEEQEVPQTTAWQQNFQCMHAHEARSADASPNARVIQILQEMADYYDRTQDVWRALAYRKAIAALKREKTKIMTKEEAQAIPGIGERLALKIDEIRRTDQLLLLRNVHTEPNDQVVQLFTGIYGVGYAQAQAWIAQGHRTLDDLRAKAELTANQRVGLEHHADFAARIPRDEARAHEQFVWNVLKTLRCAASLHVAGSYRRGHADSGDIDLLVTCPPAHWQRLRNQFKARFATALHREDYIQHVFAQGDGERGAKLLVAARLPPERAGPGMLIAPGPGGSSRGTLTERGARESRYPTWRRVDILLVPERELGAALLYFTGNQVFNRSMRLLAAKKGMRLNQHGLFEHAGRGEGGRTAGSLVESESERRIFEILGVPWRRPEERNP